MTLEFFRAQMDRLAGLKFAPADMTTHWEGLNALPEDVLEKAVSRAQQTRVDFPTPVELRQDADQACPRRQAPEPVTPELPAPVVLGTLPNGHEVRATHEWKYYCDVCHDSGIREFWCGPSRRQPWLERKMCGGHNCPKLGAGYNHSWVEPCPCATWNPEIKRRKEREARYAAERAVRA